MSNSLSEVEIELPDKFESSFSESFEKFECREESIVIESSDTSETTSRDAPVFKIAPTAGKFMNNEAALDVLLNTVDTLDRVPLGTKDNVFLVVNHLKIDKTRLDFPDDCGVWNSGAGTTNNQSFALSEDNTMTTLFKRGGVFCTRKMVKGKLVYEPCSPQPVRYITFHRYYTKLKGDDGYKKKK
ncbi:hypothetical protein SNE40_009639 [Patella caerulea]|uniref:Uncharacterized protein n=1 Tax=Patella caerulea TaxID=87958 RepID=A0AAN8JQ23_PATCE